MKTIIVKRIAIIFYMLVCTIIFGATVESIIKISIKLNNTKINDSSPLTLYQLYEKANLFDLLIRFCVLAIFYIFSLFLFENINHKKEMTDTKKDILRGAFIVIIACEIIRIFHQ